MRPRARALLAVPVLALALGLARAATPDCAAACSCAGPPQLDGNEQAVLVGMVGADDGTGRYAFAVERWFVGGDEPVVTLQSGTSRRADGTFVTNTCGLTFVSGEHLILSASREGVVLTPGSCSPHAPLDSAEGQQLLAETVAAFGPGTVPPEAPNQPTDPPAAPTSPTADLALPLALAFAIGVALATFGFVAVLAKRPRGSS